MSVSTLALNQLKPLTAAQHDRCKERAPQRINNRAADKPTRTALYRAMESVWCVVDVVALVIFVAALAISSLHILSYAGDAANLAYASSSSGISADLYSNVHKGGFIALAEAAMLLFFVLFRMQPGRERW